MDKELYLSRVKSLEEIEAYYSESNYISGKEHMLTFIRDLKNRFEDVLAPFDSLGVLGWVKFSKKNDYEEALGGAIAMGTEDGVKIGYSTEKSEGGSKEFHASDSAEGLILILKEMNWIQPNQAAHTMSANARLYPNDRMETNIITSGTLTEADIVWL